MGATSFTQLIVWQKAVDVTVEVYDLTERFPSSQRFSLISQMQRGALSVGANIAEGFGRRRPRDKARLYNIAEASAEELKHYLIVSRGSSTCPTSKSPGAISRKFVGCFAE